LKRVCVFAGANTGSSPDYRQAASDLGRFLASRSIGVVYGGARVGLMGTLADTALAAGGRVYGVIPSALVAKEIAHPHLTELHIVSSMHERKAAMVELADAFIALPGGFGTWEEFFEVLTWAQLGLHSKPCGLLNVRGYFDPLLSFFAHAIAEGFVRAEYRSMVCVADTPDALLASLEASDPPRVAKWIDPSTS
jgi:uncharacterized protein (TIGR00730 family)